MMNRVQAGVAENETSTAVTAALASIVGAHQTITLRHTFSKDECPGGRRSTQSIMCFSTDMVLRPKFPRFFPIVKSVLLSIFEQQN